MAVDLSPTSVWLICVLVAGVAIARRLRSVAASQLPLPPGPPKLPILGNAFNIPAQSPQSWKEYAALAERYGDVMHFNVFGQSIIVLSSIKAVTDLLEKRSAKYSSRARSVMMHDLMGLDWSVVLMPYGPKWRQTRRAVHQYLHPGVVDKYKDIQLQSARKFLVHMKNAPDHLFRLIRLSFASAVLKVVYDMDIKDPEDPYIEMVEDALIGPNLAALPGRFLVETVPIMRYIPPWFPGAQFRRIAARSRFLFDKIISDPFKMTKERMNTSASSPCMLVTMLKRAAELDSGSEEAEEVSRNAAVMTYIAGADTTVSTVQAFVRAMILYPDVQRKAQDELSAVVGPTRLPTFEDRVSLPYVEALTMEALRWHLVLPLGVPHFTTEEDEYRGYRIPKGTIVMGNSWAILHDSVAYPNPEQFDPERFLKDGQINPVVQTPDISAFGYGRRICPGRYFAKNSLFIMVASILHTYNITKAVDEKGVPIPVETNVTSGAISYPVPYQYSFKPRSAITEALIDNMASAEEP